MSLAKPTGFLAIWGDQSVFLRWLPVLNASKYEICIKSEDTRATTFDYTTETCFTKTSLENGKCYLAQLTAITDDRHSEPSIILKFKPKSGASSSSLSVKRGSQSGRISLKWTNVPAHAGYKIERCNVSDVEGYVLIATIRDTATTTYEDQTNCDTSQQSCLGHFYTVSTLDTTWASNGSILSKKIFCTETRALNSPTIASAVSSTVAVPKLSPSITFVARPGTTESNLQPPRQKAETHINKQATSQHITPERVDIYNEFQKHINALTAELSRAPQPTEIKPVSTTIGKGTIEVGKGDITKQKVDVIIASSSSEILKQIIINAGGAECKAAYETEYKNNPGSLLITTPPVAFPAIGCGKHGCSVDVVVKTMPEQQNIFDEFCKQVLASQVGKTTLGNSSMKTRPVGFDTTTDGNHIFVTYHDAQAFAEYLITYK
ncbi:unnamed protein product [Didymodactylos carnosus]|uniref:Fibronectin type-III domain-containing protein n=1 Tax=Didymodactylos carnosus TaxID=1234261 RepID=A0A814DHW6_9BILA|nr:unnamed protein product [Didymodactylos carnosus]CAF3731083.1 unnamed protein product [Didymodactylos carnosus]